MIHVNFSQIYSAVPEKNLIISLLLFLALAAILDSRYTEFSHFEAL